MEGLISKVDRLKALEKSFSHSLNEAKENNSALEQAVKHLIEWASVKKQIKLATINTSVFSIPGSKNIEAREIIQKINLDERLHFENIFAGTAFEKLFDADLGDDEINSLESDLFYSWFSGYDFVRELYSVGTLIASAGDLPSSLSEFIDELRLCYVFQRYLAVYALCRTVLDISLRDVYDKNNLNNQESKNYRQVKETIYQTEKFLPREKNSDFPKKIPHSFK